MSSLAARSSTGMGWYLACLLAFLPVLQCRRFEQAHSAAFQMLASSTSSQSADHHEQLGMESYTELMQAFHTNLSTMTWPVTPTDVETIGQVLELVNPNGVKVWEWERSPEKWVYQITMNVTENITRESQHEWAVGALALHMLHHHGLAPLASSAHHKGFQDFEPFYIEHRQQQVWKRQRKQAFGVEATAEAKVAATTGVGAAVQALQLVNTRKTNKIKEFVSALEEHPLVATLRQKMNAMTLDGLRNMHSYDHQWSVANHDEKTGVAKLHGCSETAPGKCAFQASASRSPHDFMKKYGFTADLASKLHIDGVAFMSELMRMPPQERNASLQHEDRRLQLWAYEEANFFRFFEDDIN